jgi:type I restriction enzyme S subunit
MTTSAANSRAFAVWFKDLDRWDPSSFERIIWEWPKDSMRPIAEFLRPRKEKVDRGKYQFSDLQPITIHFDGSIDRREMDANREYTMELFFARPGDVVIAKIDLKNGAVAIVPDWKNAAVTGHFAVYEPDRKAILPEYFLRVIQTGFFKAHLWRNKVGAEGRKEVKLDFFEALEIPLPPLPVQRAVVRRWQEAQDEIVKAQARVDALEEGNTSPICNGLYRQRGKLASSQVGLQR